MAIRQRKKSKKNSRGMEGQSNVASNHTPGAKRANDNNASAAGASSSVGFSRWKVAVAMLFVVIGIVFLSLFVFSDALGGSSSSESSVSSSREDGTSAPTAAVAGTRTHAPATTNVDASTHTPQPTTSPSEGSTPVTPPLQRTQRGTYRLLDQWPHDPKAFCQGLEVKNETHLYESIGLYGESAMRIVERQTGKVTLETIMPDAFFGEGVSLIEGGNEDDDGYLLQLTWKEKTAFLYHPKTLEELSRFPYETTNTQGWGIAHDPHRDVAYVTDGTEFVHTWKLTRDDDGTVSYQEIAKFPVTVRFADSPVDEPQILQRINELEYDPVTRTLLANVWFENALIRIDVDSGFVTNVYDLSSLYTNRDPNADVLNGIALIPNHPGHFYVTGKLWPSLYHIELVDL